jgi:hypothetical protein
MKVTNSDIADDFEEFDGLRPMERHDVEQWQRKEPGQSGRGWDDHRRRQDLPA